MQPSSTEHLGRFFELAQRECCNYSAIGPFQRKHYCCLEPRRTEYQCLLSRDLPCRWFVEAVLPLDKVLQRDWGGSARICSDPATPAPAPQTIRICQCGARFLARSNRQRMCLFCSRNNRRKLTRDAVRKHRHNAASK